MAIVDSTVLGTSHMYLQGRQFVEPEGILSTIPAVAQVMIGFVCGASVLATSFFRSQLGIEIKPNLVLAILAVVGVGVYALSWRMAITFYKKREIQ